MVTQSRVPVTRSGLPCLPPPPAPHRAGPSTAVASPSARCSIARCRPILLPGWRFRMMASGRARPRPPSGNSAATSTAASSPTASPVPAALRADMISSLPTPASVAACVPPAPPAAWWRPPRIWLTMSLRAWPVRQWVLSVPKRLRYHLEGDPAVLNAALYFLAAAAAMRLNLLRRLACAETSFSRAPSSRYCGNTVPGPVQRPAKAPWSSSTALARCGAPICTSTA